jgi:hypothetical protein
MRYVTTEMINLRDYGMNANVTWEELSAVNEGPAEHMAGITPASGPWQA